MKTKFVNPNNPLRKAASAQIPTAKPATPVIKTARSKADEQTFDETGVLNPRHAGSGERVYDGKGELNAWDKKDALTKSAYLMNHVASANPFARMNREAARADEQERRRVLKAAANDADGMRIIAQEAAYPIKQVIDYEGFARKLFKVRTFAQGEWHRMPRDVRGAAYAVGQDGKGIEVELTMDYVTIPEVKITSFMSVDIWQLLQGNYDIFDRGVDTSKQEIMLQEDLLAVDLLDAMSESGTNAVTNWSTLSLAVFENTRYQVEQHRLVVDKFLMNRAELRDVQINMSGSLDPVSQRELNLAGYWGRFLGADIMTCAGRPEDNQEVVPAGTIYAVTSPDYLGEMGIRLELMSQEYNGIPNQQFKKGIGFIEIIGFGATSDRPCAKAVRS